MQLMRDCAVKSHWINYRGFTKREIRTKFREILLTRVYNRNTAITSNVGFESKAKGTMLGPERSDNNDAMKSLLN